MMLFADLKLPLQFRNCWKFR